MFMGLTYGLSGAAAAAPPVGVALFRGEEGRMAQAEVKVALAKAWGNKAEVVDLKGEEPPGVTFLAGPALAALGASCGCGLVVTGEKIATGPKGIRIEVALWQVDPPARLVLSVQEGPTSTLRALAERIATEVVLVEPLEPKLVALAVPAPPKLAVVGPGTEVNSSVSPGPPPTTNPLARGAFIGGGVLLGVGLVLGLVSQVVFAGPLVDGTVRPGSENDDLLSGARTTGAIADVGLGLGLAVGAFGAVAWLTELGAVEQVSP